jgi:3-hydroxybutyryl-CoA dehydrogenase
MKKHTSDNVHAAPVAALMGDEQLTRECIPVLEAYGIEVIPANDEHAIRSAASRLTAALDVTILSTGVKKERIQFLDACVPSSVPIISSSVTVTALTQSQWMKHPARLIGFSGFPTLFSAPLIDLAPSAFTADETVRAARDFFSLMQKETVCVQDRTGMIVPAMIAQIVNEALMAVHQNVASAQDIDTAMKLGAGYPLGPIEWGEKIGFSAISAVLEARRCETGEERWRSNPLLRQLAVVGTFWHEPALVPEYIQERLLLDTKEEETLQVQEDTAKPKSRKAPKKKNPEE